MEKDKLIAILIVGVFIVFIIIIMIGLFLIYKNKNSTGNGTGNNTKNTCPVVPYSQSGITATPAIVEAGGSALPGKPLTQKDSVGWYLNNSYGFPIKLVQQYYTPNSQQPSIVNVPTGLSGYNTVSYLDGGNQPYPLFPSMTFYVLNSSNNTSSPLTVPINTNPSTDVIVINYSIDEKLSASVCNSNGSTPVLS